MMSHIKSILDLLSGTTESIEEKRNLVVEFWKKHPCIPIDAEFMYNDGVFHHYTSSVEARQDIQMTYLKTKTGYFLMEWNYFTFVGCESLYISNNRTHIHGVHLGRIYELGDYDCVYGRCRVDDVVSRILMFWYKHRAIPMHAIKPEQMKPGKLVFSVCENSLHSWEYTENGIRVYNVKNKVWAENNDYGVVPWIYGYRK